MSSLIIQNDPVFACPRPPLRNARPNQLPSDGSQPLSTRIYNHLLPLLRDAPGYLLSCARHAHTLTLTLLYSDLAPPHALLQRLCFDSRSQTWTNQLHPLDASGCFLKVCNLDKLGILWRKYLLRSRLPFRLAFDHKNGAVVLFLPDILPLAALHEQQVSRVAEQLHRVVRQTFAFLRFQAQQLLWEIYEDCGCAVYKFTEANFAKKRKALPRELERYRHYLGISISLESEGEAEVDSAVKEEVEAVSRQRLLERQVRLGAEFRLVGLFIQAPEECFRELRAQELEISVGERQGMQRQLTVQFPEENLSPNDNDYILNCIKFDSHQLHLFRVHSSNFSTVFTAFANFWYVYSGDGTEMVGAAGAGEQSFKKEKLLKKPIVIKRQIGSNRNRIEHEKSILKQIKGGKAYFIPKYYLSTDENEYKQDLLLDYLHEQFPLDTYLLYQRRYLTIASRLYILYMILQGARYISLYSIVHLDLKPANIMVSDALRIKIIDFGESYHPAICNGQTKYAPGFTAPYGAPEAYATSCSSHFTQKCDVFSIGVIAHELLFARRPFSFNEHDRKARHRVYKDLEFTNHMFYVGEELRGYGDSVVFPIVQWAVGRCLEPEPWRRPSLDWLCLVMRECVEFYQSRMEGVVAKSPLIKE